MPTQEEIDQSQESWSRRKQQVYAIGRYWLIIAVLTSSGAILLGEFVIAIYAGLALLLNFIYLIFIREMYGALEGADKLDPGSFWWTILI